MMQSFLQPMAVARAGATPPEEPDSRGGTPEAWPELRLMEASLSGDRKCADCGKRTSQWRPVRRNGLPVILCLECAAKNVPPEAEACPECGAPLRHGDSFCGKCGARIEYACPQCGSTLESDDVFCGKCGTRLT